MECEFARQNSQQTYASVTIQAESGPAAINKMQGTQKSPMTSQMAHLSPSFSKNCLPTIVPSNLQKLDSALWDCSSLCGLRKKLHGIKAARQRIEPMTCSQALLLSQSMMYLCCFHEAISISENKVKIGK